MTGVFRGAAALLLVFVAASAPAAWTDRYVTDNAPGGGDGSSGNPWTLPEAITNAAAGMRINVKAGTYPNTTTTRTFATSGTVTAPIWWRGYKTAIADMDAPATSHGAFGAATEVPYWTWTTPAGACVVSGQYQIFQNIDFVSANTNGSNVGTIYTSNGPNQFIRCRVENTQANANSYGVFSTGPNCVFAGCGFKATSSAPCFFCNSANFCRGCYFRGGSNGFFTNAASCQVTGSIFDDNGVDAMRVSGSFLCDGNTVYSPGSDGLQIDSAGHTVIANTIFSACGAYDVNNAAANDFLIRRFGNLSHAPGTAHDTGFGDSPEHWRQTDASSPFVDAANGDFTPAASSNAIGNAFPTDFTGLRW